KLLGIDISAALFGSPWTSWRPDDRFAMVLQGFLVSVTILFGSLLTAGIIALLTNRPPKTKTGENKTESQEAGK
ncbi:MAG: hypothetical protein Q7R57_00120, partial [Dehalococcoidales bacterium]|nr:hypothetical protein [Dehalococcoidales bacterium]